MVNLVNFASVEILFVRFARHPESPRFAPLDVAFVTFVPAFAGSDSAAPANISSIIGHEGETYLHYLQKREFDPIEAKA